MYRKRFTVYLPSSYLATTPTVRWAGKFYPDTQWRKSKREHKMTGNSWPWWLRAGGKVDRDKTTYKIYGLLPLWYKEIIDYFEFTCFVLCERTETCSETAICSITILWGFTTIHSTGYGFVRTLLVKTHLLWLKSSPISKCHSILYGIVCTTLNWICLRYNTVPRTYSTSVCREVNHTLCILHCTLYSRVQQIWLFFFK
jgi:hypothetical protein